MHFSPRLRGRPEPSAGPWPTESLAAMRDDEPAEAAVACPVLFLVDADPQARARTESALVRRFGLDYTVESADSASAGLAVLERLVRAGTPVALVAADLHLPGMGGIDFLNRAHQLHRDASRVLMVAMDRHHKIGRAHV